MTELRKEKKHEVQQSVVNDAIPLESKLHLVFLGLLSASFIGYFATHSIQKPWIGLVFAHLAALSIMGFYGCFAGAIAKKKGHSYGLAFQIGFFLPIILGVIAGLLGPAGGRDLPLTCGGWVSLGTGIIVVLSYFIIRKRRWH